MNCQEYQQVAIETLTELGDKPFPEDLQSHLETCAACREEVQGLRHLLGDLKALPVPDPGEWFFARQRRRIEEGVSQEPLRRPRPLGRGWWPAWAAAAMLVLFLGYSFFFRGPGIPGPAEWSAALQWLAHQNGWGEEDVDVNDLDERQLNAYAEIMEERMLDADEESVEADEPSDWQDLDRQELDLLIKRLQSGLGGRRS